MLRTSWALTLALLLPAQIAKAQTPQATPPSAATQQGAATPPSADGAGVAATTATTAASGPGDDIIIDDPMLDPVPPATNVLSDWREALELVKTRSTSYLTAHAQIEVARGQSRMALGTVLPKLIGDAQYTRYLNRFPAPAPGSPEVDRDNWSAGAVLRVPVLSARNWYDYATSRREINRVALQTEDAERLVIGGLAEALVAVITAERLSEVTRVSLSGALAAVDLNMRRSRLGSGSEIDVLRARQEANSSRAQVVQADEALRKAREALGTALGYSDDWGVTPDLKLDQLRQDARDTCTSGEEIHDRADVRAAAAGAAIAKRNVTSVMFSYLPLIDVSSRVNHSASNNFFFPDTTWTIGAALTWHLYDGGVRYGERRRNLGLYEQSKQQSIEAERSAELEVTQSTRGVTVARTSLEIAQEARDIALDNAKLAKAKFMNGTGTSFDMIDTQSTARRTELDVTVREFELLRAEIIAFLALASCEL